ncbi:pulmonary surfactant-associated protein C-like [Rhinatrema bivittatum]|uniref:pulmonary surfactant-associated protein C-like n=1 Tax=Rhinatrema bivittatum TaxID=194408 RepID=UPI00112806C6|nr:pulmonary surfactant-associated protein C-like [Rhinatrema bivittatum]
MCIISIAVVVLSLIAVAAILIGVKMTQDHTEKIFQITHNENGKETLETATVNKDKGVATFYVTGVNTSAIVVYDYTNSVIGVKGDSSSCYVTKMDVKKVPSLDSISEKYQSLQQSSSNSSATHSQQSAYFKVQKEPVADRSLLGTTINVLCSNNPIYWMQESSDASNTRAYVCHYVKICILWWCYLVCLY